VPGDFEPPQGTGSYLRLTWVLADIVPGGGGTALLPGSRETASSGHTTLL
jgi:hypothetical protein